MTTQQAQFIRRIQELEETSYRNNQFLFTDFLNEAEYADVLSLGEPALVNLGIERRVLGDILIDGVTAYLLCRDQMADYICENLTKVKHTNVRCSRAQSIPDTLQPKPVSRQVQVSSVRLDAVIAHVYNLSRSQAQEVFRSQRVFVNGRLMENLNFEPKDGIPLQRSGAYDPEGKAKHPGGAVYLSQKSEEMKA